MKDNLVRFGESPTQNASLEDKQFTEAFPDTEVPKATNSKDGLASLFPEVFNNDDT